MSPISGIDSLALAKRHLEKVQMESVEDPDWLILASSGLYSLEAAVVAAAIRLGLTIKRTHHAKVDAARQLAIVQGFPDVAGS